MRQKRAEQEAIAKREIARRYELRRKHHEDWAAAMEHANRLQVVAEKHGQRMRKQAVTRITTFVKTWLLERRKLKRRKSAEKIQRVYRLRRHVVRANYDRRVARRIQRMFRGFRGRQAARKRLEVENFEHVDDVTKRRLDEFSHQTLHRVRWSDLPDRMVLETCIGQVGLAALVVLSLLLNCMYACRTLWVH